MEEKEDHKKVEEKRVVDEEEEGRWRGRPISSWRELIDKEIKIVGLEDNLWEDRDQWRLGIGRRWIIL